MKSEAATVGDYLASLPEARCKPVAALRNLVRKSIPDGYEEAMSWGMISYEVPLTTFSKTYNGKPLAYAAIASQKNHMALYLLGLYCKPGAEAAFRKAWKGGKKLDLGKSCLRFKSLDDLDLDLIASTIASTSVADFIQLQQTARKK